MSTSVRIENLTKNYGKVNALDNFSLEVDPGEFMVLLGPSGCGKTTAVRCIAGLSDPKQRNHSHRRSIGQRFTPKRQRYCYGISKLCSLPPYVSI